jgi:hypothetical protein
MDKPHSEGLLRTLDASLLPQLHGFGTRDEVSWPLLAGIQDDTHWVPHNQIVSYGLVMLFHLLHLQGF